MRTHPILPIAVHAAYDFVAITLLLRAAPQDEVRPGAGVVSEE